MSYSKALRSQLGITQETIAALIGCNPSQLAMNEIGKRELAFAADRLLFAMDKAAATASSQSCPNPIVDEVAGKWLNRQIRVASAKKQSLLLKQEKVTEKIQQAGLLLQVVSLLETDLLFMEEELAMLQLTILKRKCIEKLQFLQLARMKLQVNICSLSVTITEGGSLLSAMAMH